MQSTRLLAVALVVPMVAACATPARRATPVECALMGAAAGGGAGAITGNRIENDTEETAIGGAIGIVAGAALGYAICALLPEPAPPPPPVKKAQPPPPPPAPKPKPPPPPPPVVKKERIVLRGVNFALNSATLDPSSEVVLDVAAQTLLANPDIKISVQGHTDSTGSDEYNDNLSQRRAKSVWSYLVKKGVAPGRLEAIGRGEREPVAGNDTSEGRRLNRRVELKQGWVQR